MLFGVENGLKVYKGRHEALGDKAFYNQLATNEQAFRARVAQDPALAREYGGVWDAIAALVQKDEMYRTEYNALERGVRTSTLFSMARNLVRHGDEIAKPNGERLREFGESRLPQMKAAILADEPIYDELEIAMLTWSLTRVRADLGADHPIVKRVFGKRSPAQIATDVVRHTRLKELKVDAHGNAIGGYRKALYDGGKAAVDASHDPMIELARALDPDARAIRKKVETEVDGPMKRQQELLAKARFAVYGDSRYPDATFTLRLSYGQMKGYPMNGTIAPPMTTLYGLYDRSASFGNKDPFELPQRYVEGREKLDLSTPFNFVTTNDIIGGNSGSPVVNKNGEIVGLIFDGNIESLVGDFVYEIQTNRAVAVHTAAMTEALRKLYGADKLVNELLSAPN
jgi:hypothetical protein